MSQEFLIAAAVPITCAIMALLFAVPWVVWWRYGRKGKNKKQCQHLTQ